MAMKEIDSGKVIVETPYGSLKGIRADGLSVFHRVPYAAPPLGPLRYEKPAPLRPWQGVRDAGIPAPVPPQLPSRLEAVMGSYAAAKDEDCLHLDIWSPHEAGAKAPVLVFIHGGAFMTGGGSLPCYDGARLARETGAVVITITYRLGILGFLPQERVGSANPGLHDQIAALRWIREAVSSFGGDPESITVASQSAGAASIAILLSQPALKGLFRRAILMSAPLGVPLKTLDESRAIMDDALALAGVSASSPEKLKELPLSVMMETQLGLLRKPPAFPYDVTPPFMPVIDGDLVKGPLLQTLDAAENWCEVIIGFTREESAAFYAFNPAIAAMPETAMIEAFRAAYPSEGPAAFRKAKASRLSRSNSALLSDLCSERDFIGPSLAYAAMRGAAGCPTYVYQFDWQSPVPALGACHCIDLPFLFGNFDVWTAAPMVKGGDQAEMQALAATLRGHFAAFAASGHPNGPDLPLWPAFGATKAVLHLDRRIQALGLPA